MSNIINYVLNRNKSDFVKENEQSGQRILSEEEEKPKDTDYDCNIESVRSPRSERDRDIPFFGSMVFSDIEPTPMKLAQL